MIFNPRFRHALFLLAWISGATLAAEENAAVQLAQAGRPMFSVAVAPSASQRVRDAAKELADALSKITGGSFACVEANDASGILVGTTTDFPDVRFDAPSGASDFSADERYLLRSHERGVLLIGQTDAGVENAVWDFLYRLGWRQFFPGPEWEIIPRSPDLSIDVDVVEQPDYALRQIWPGWGTWPENDVELKQWDRRNRAHSAFVLNTGHAYEIIVPHYKAVFDQHPEYYALVDGKRTGDKMCISNPDVRKLVVEYSLQYLKDHPQEQSVSVEPSDGYGWCECAPCAEIGQPTDRALFLANTVATAMEKEYPDKYVGMYAYAAHSPPPARVMPHPKVIISVATAFQPRGTPEEILAGWKERGVKQFGIREYFSVIAWDHDWPGAANGSNTTYLSKTIPQFHEMGARFLTAESSDNWGPNGLGYYLAARMMWDVDQAKNIDAHKQDFYDKAFGPAAGPIKVFYDAIDGGNKPLLSSDLIGRMYRSLDEARKLAGDDAAIQKRIDALILYTRYVELYRAYDLAQGDARQAGYAALIQHAYRIRRTHMVHSLALYRDLHTRDTTIAIPPGAEYDVPEGQNPWKNSAPWSKAEMDQILSGGIAGNELLSFTPVSFSDKIVPAARRLGLKTPAETATPLVRQDRGTVRYYTWIEKAPATIKLEVTGGLAYGTLGDVRVRLFPVDEVLGRAVSEQIVPPDQKPHPVILRTTQRGLHYVEIFDNHDATRVKLESPIAWTAPLSFAMRYDSEDQDMYFYVPRGTKVLGGYAGVNRGKILDPDGKVALELSPKPDFFSIPVPKGQDGKLWKLVGQTYEGRFMLMTVPPYMARSAEELLLPQEVK